MSGDWIVNPDWQSATYELRFKDSAGKVFDDPWPRRFNVPPPNDAWEGGEGQLWNWVLKNEIPRMIPAQKWTVERVG